MTDEQLTQYEYVPLTPSGTPLTHLKSSTPEEAWKLLVDDTPPHYPDIDALKLSGYSVWVITVDLAQ